MKTHLIRPALVILAAVLLIPGSLRAQEMVSDGGFEEGAGTWMIYDMVSDVPATVEASTDPNQCPSNGEGTCMVISAPSGYTNTLVWQELTLKAGEPYTLDAEFRQLGDTLVDTWVEFYMSPLEPTMDADYNGGPNGVQAMAFNTWTGCGYGVDGSFSEFGCAGANDPIFVPAGTPGEDVTIYVGIKAGTNNADYAFSISLDDISVMGAGEAFAVAAFSRDPLYRVPVNYEIDFDASGSSGSSEIATYEWDFGDGSSATGATVSHTYSEMGDFDVTLTVTGADGGTGTVTRSINVFEGTGSLVRPLEIPRATAVPSIDGVEDAVWADAQTISLESVASGPAPDDAADLSGTLSLLWDETAVYGLFRVTDDQLQNDSPAETWQDDGVEFYLDAGNEKEFEGYDDNDVQYTMNWNSTQFTGNGAGRIEGASYVTAATDDGYLLEFVMPWANVDLTPTAGTVIGTEAMINDDDDGTTRDHKLGWYAIPGVDNAHQQAHLFGSAVLVEELTTAAEPEAGVPGTFSIESVYPNPFNPSTTAVLSITRTGDYTVKVFDMLGRLVQEQALNATAPGQIAVPISLADQASGLYLITVEHTMTSGRASTRVMLVK